MNLVGEESTFKGLIRNHLEFLQVGEITKGPEKLQTS